MKGAIGVALQAGCSSICFVRTCVQRLPARIVSAGGITYTYENYA